MKRDYIHPSTPSDLGTNAFRSVGQIEDAATYREWLEREFPEGVAELQNEEDRELSRRSFMKLMGASTALAGLGLASCRRPEAQITPYANAPEWVVPGKPTFYATARPTSFGAAPLYATTHEGRPTKLEPNRLNPDSSGVSGFTQASILDLYSPDRSKHVLQKGNRSTLEDFKILFNTIAASVKDPATKCAFIFGEDDSPSRNRLVKKLSSINSNAKFYRYEALVGEDSIQALESTFGPGTRAKTNLSKASRILSLDADFLGNEPQGNAKDFAAGRKPEGANYENTTTPDYDSMNRLYVVEGQYSLTGGMADHRLRVAPSQVIKVAIEIARALGVSGLESLPITNQLGDIPSDAFATWIKACAEDLQSHAGKSLVLTGKRQPKELQLLTIAINQKLNAIGGDKPLNLVKTDLGLYANLNQFKKDQEANSFQYLFLMSPANPAYDAPFDFSKVIQDAQAKGLKVFHFGLNADATAHLADWHIPAAHYLESWGDSRTISGIYSLIQPMILPLYGGFTDLEILAGILAEEPILVAGEDDKGTPSLGYTAVRETLSDLTGGQSKAVDAKDPIWLTVGRDGMLANNLYSNAGSGSPKLSDLSQALQPEPSKESLELVFTSDYSVYDGRFINNAWLQENPDPISKVTWDNIAQVSPQTAKDLGIYNKLVELEPLSGLGIKNAQVPVDGEAAEHKAPVVEIELNGTKIQIAVQVGFGVADNTVFLPLGYGQGYDEHHELHFDTAKQNQVGQVGVNTGFDVNPLRRIAGKELFASGGRMKTTGDRYLLAMTSEHHSMYGRALARETTPSELAHASDDHKKGPKYHAEDSHVPNNQSLYKQDGSKFWTGKEGKDGANPSLLNDPIHQWSMAIDLSSCTGCNACQIACQAENNIPVVGKRQVAMGREMHWIRMDRYFAESALERDDEGHAKAGANEAPQWIQSNPAMITQPVACQQCEAAPCETVCPVNATVHTEEGLNAMAYNRCIGTRYCANNCPYKARRFNFFDYNKRNPLLHKNLYKGPLGETQVSDGKHLQRNPDVSVRMRGVMEKCTYCVQRLEKAKIRQKQTHKKLSQSTGKVAADFQVLPQQLRIPVDSVRVACQEACTMDAISFGNILDENKAVVNRAKSSKRNYDLLNYINTKPRTSFLAKAKNPNPNMPDAAYIGRATVDMH